jgi:predicted DNA-binding transcriptional regulator AlpA
MGTTPRRLVEPADLVGPSEVCQLLGGISRPTLMRYRRGDFPSPWRELEIGPVWIASDVLKWAEASRPRSAGA